MAFADDAWFSIIQKVVYSFGADVQTQTCKQTKQQKWKHQPDNFVYFMRLICSLFSTSQGCATIDFLPWRIFSCAYL